MPLFVPKRTTPAPLLVTTALFALEITPPGCVVTPLTTVGSRKVTSVVAAMFVSALKVTAQLSTKLGLEVPVAFTVIVGVVNPLLTKLSPPVLMFTAPLLEAGPA